MTATATPETLKAANERYAEVKQSIGEKRTELRELSAKLHKLDPTAEDFAETFKTYSEEFDTAEETLSSLESEQHTLDSQIATLKKASQYSNPDVDPSRTNGGSDDHGDGDTPSYLEAKGSDGADLMSSYSYRDGRDLKTGVFNSATTFTVPATAGTRKEPITGGLLAHPQYEQAVRAYTRYVGLERRADSFSRFVQDRASEYSAIANVIEGIGIPMLPARMINLFECEKRENYFIRMLSTVHNVTDNCCLELWKRGDKVSSFSWGHVCEEPPKSGVPGANHKVLQPRQWTQAAQICRRQLECNAIDPLMLLLLDMEDERLCELEFAYLYENGFEKPLGLLSDTSIPMHFFTAEEIDDEGCLADPATSLLNLYCAMPAACRRNPDNVWIMKDKQYCKLLKAQRTGEGCCKHGFFIDESIGPDGARMATLRGPGLPARPLYVIDDRVCEKLEERYPDHPAKDILVSFGSLRPFHIADFALGTTLETDDNILADTRCWVRRQFTDALYCCPQFMIHGKAPSAMELSAKTEQAIDRVRQDEANIAREHAGGMSQVPGSESVNTFDQSAAETKAVKATVEKKAAKVRKNAEK